MRNIYLLLLLPIIFFSCSSNKDVTISDPNLAAAVQDALGLGPTAPIPQKKLEELEHLDNKDVTISDPNLAAAVQDALGLGPTAPIPQKKLEELEHLDADDRGLTYSHS